MQLTINEVGQGLGLLFLFPVFQGHGLWYTFGAQEVLGHAVTGLPVYKLRGCSGNSLQFLVLSSFYTDIVFPGATVVGLILTVSRSSHTSNYPATASTEAQFNRDR